MQRGDGYEGEDQTYGVSVIGQQIAIQPNLADEHSTSPAPLTLQTTSISRGTSLASAPGAFTREGDGQLSAGWSATVSEHLANQSTGVEQSWTFDAKPSGIGDLVVRIAAGGEQFTASTPSGLHFTDPQTGLGIVYSHARWNDASGGSVDIPVKYEAGEIVATVPQALVDHSSYPAVLDPAVSAEIGIDAPIYAAAADEQSAPAIGYSGTPGAEYLAVWRDRRRFGSLGSELYGAHISLGGAVVETTGFLITDPNEGGENFDPAVQWDEAESFYVIAFAHQNGTASVVYARRIPGGNGTATDGGGPVSPSFGPSRCINCRRPAIAWNYYAGGQGRFFIAWEDNAGVSGTSYTYSTTSPFLISPATPASGYRIGNTGTLKPSVAGSMPRTGGPGNRFLVTWSDAASVNVFGSYYLENGASSIGPFSIFTAASNTAPYVSAQVSFCPTTSTWLVTADHDVDATSAINYDVVVAEVASTGSVGPELRVATGALQQIAPAIAANGGPSGSQALITWEQFATTFGGTGTIMAARVDNANHVLSNLDPSGISLGGTIGFVPRAPTISDEASQYFVVWGDQRTTDLDVYDVYGSRISSGGAVLDMAGGILISKAANKQTSPAVAACGGTYLVAWSDQRGTAPGSPPTAPAGDTDLYGELFDRNGNVVVPAFLISGAPRIQDHPAIGCAGSSYFVVWDDGRNLSPNLYGTAVEATGVVKSPAGVLITSSAAQDQSPAIAYDDTTKAFWVVWAASGQIRAQRTTVAGELLGTVVPMPSTNPSSNPDIAFDGVEFLVVWQGRSAIFGTTLEVDSTVSAAFLIDSAANQQRYPKVQLDRDTGIGLCVYEDDRNFSTHGTDIYATPVSATGPTGTAFGLATTEQDELTPRIAHRSGALMEVTFARTLKNAFESDVLGQSLNNAALVGVPYAVSAKTEDDEQTPAIDCISDTHCLDTYRAFDLEDVHAGTDRVKARALFY